MKKKLTTTLLLLALIAISACNITTAVPAATAPAFPEIQTSSPATAGSEVIVVPTLPVTYEPPTSEPPTPTSIALNGNDISFFGTSFTIPAGLASGTQNDIQAQANDANVSFNIHPAYTRITLQGYPLQNKAFEPLVQVYPAKEFAQISEGAAMIINNLQNTLSAQSASPAEPIPFLPLFNASQIFHAQEKFIAFKNGTGVRYITQFDQAPLPINNTELFYTFQGLTNDGEYYVSVIMPINLPYLPADNNLDSPTPADGIPFPWTNGTDFPNYLNSMIDRLNQTDNPFTPSLETLDTLVQSIASYGMH